MKIYLHETQENAMKSLVDQVQETLLMGPGPSSVPPEVYAAISQYSLGHLDPFFIKIMDAIKDQLRQVMKTTNKITLPMSGTGSAGMETVLVNLIEPGDNVLVLINGVFGGRMKEIAGRLRAEVDSLEFEWGTPVVPDQVKDQLSKKKYKLVAVVHAETSTGVANPVEEIGTLVKEHGALYVVDAVTSLGGMPVLVDDWGIDALYSGTQKCLSCPPGLSPVTVSERAAEVIKGRKTKVPNWYLDLSLLMNYWEGSSRAYHHTAPINMNYALYAALKVVLDEGLENVWARHRKTHMYLIQKLGELGFTMLVDEPYRLPMLNAVVIPDGVDDKAVRGRLLEEHRIEIGGGLGALAGKIWRVGIMGYNARNETVDRLADALKKIM
jgi:alanine-glyoxylate transaminase / serine-glyoxylate transaminase / serine-pyruvate transaminase